MIVTLAAFERPAISEGRAVPVWWRTIRLRGFLKVLVEKRRKGGASHGLEDAVVAVPSTAIVYATSRP